ncbi:MAG TPA: NAD+ synthase [Acidimicrobiales bacterium]|nr:NAD+ synthase [Acidimicrobiales bacterium]
MARLLSALCQIDTAVGDLEGNVRRIVAALEEAERAGADLAVFPELAVTGYPPEDLLLEPAFLAAQVRALEEVAASTRRCAAVVGYVHVGRGLHNAAAVCANGKVHGVCYKKLLPNYGVFDERRWFLPAGGDSPLFSVAGVRVGVTICEDAWHPEGPVARLAAAGAEVVVSVNASPYRAGALAEREPMLATRARDSGCVLVYVNLVGGQDELVFDGGSMVFDEDGALVASVPQFAEGVFFAELEVPAFRRPRPAISLVERPELELPLVVVSEAAPGERASVPAPRAAPSGRVEAVYAALRLATRDYVEKNGFGDVVVGLSGGIDSALVATIAADALGPRRVHAVSMPSRFSSPGSLTDAAELASNLGIDLRTIPIEAAHEAMLGLLAPSFAGLPPDIAEENLQARIRGTLLMALSNKFGWLVLTTGNKSETAVGYSTLYGDTAGGFAVIRDVPKTLVYELATYRNELAGTFLIPKAILEKAPTAELRPGQRDVDSLPPYEVLDPILEGYVERGLGVGELVEAGFEEAVVRRVLDLVDRAEYKRRQAPPGPRVTSRGFGKDRRMPITNRFRAAAPPRFARTGP